MADNSWKASALTVREAYKGYGSQAVLRGLNMTVQKGSIYGLLGPSGCGKTTLFKCIVGRQYLDSGEIVLGSREKQDIGYMPQELSLYNEFSIKESLVYYGTLYGMSSEAIARRTSELVSLFSLPSLKRIIRKMSGGQKRRLSFAITLLHNPQLLILDEPTVGVDPVLCHNIWQYLLELAKVEQKTIVITTHYIEEARQADVIGLMREGVLLAEESPQALMASHQCDSLEEVFLLLSKKQSDTQSSEHNQEVRRFSQPINTSKPPLNESYFPRSYRIKAQFMKSLYWMFGNIPIMVFVMGIPIMQVLLFNFCIGNDPKDLRVGFFTEEVSGGLADCDSAPLKGCHLDSLLSCRYIRTMENKNMLFTKFNSIEDGMTAVKRNDVWGLIKFPTNYSEYYNIRISNMGSTSDEDIDSGEINVWMDMSDYYIGNMIKRDLHSGFIDFQQSLFQDCGWPPAAGKIPIGYEDAVFGSNRPVFTHYGAPAMATVIFFYMPMLFTVASILMEKTEGLMDRNMTAEMASVTDFVAFQNHSPDANCKTHEKIKRLSENIERLRRPGVSYYVGLNLIELLIPHVVIQMAINIIHIIIVFTINFAIFKFPMIGNWFLFTCLCILIGVSGMCYGLLMAAICNSDTQATVMGIGTFFPLTMLSGMMWPVEGMHYILRPFSFLLPLTQSTEAYRAITARAWPMQHPAVYSGFFSCIFWTVVFLLISGATVKWWNGTGNKK